MNKRVQELSAEKMFRISTRAKALMTERVGQHEADNFFSRNNQHILVFLHVTWLAAREEMERQ